MHTLLQSNDIWKTFVYALCRKVRFPFRKVLKGTYKLQSDSASLSWEWGECPVPFPDTENTLVEVFLNSILEKEKTLLFSHPEITVSLQYHKRFWFSWNWKEIWKESWNWNLDCLNLRGLFFMRYIFKYLPRTYVFERLL